MRCGGFVALVKKTLQSVVDQARRAAADGLTLEETQKRIDMTGLRNEFAGDDPFRRKAFDDYFAPSVVASAWKEAKGVPIDEAPFPAK